MKRLRLLVLAAAVCPGIVEAQPQVRIVDQGRGGSGRVLATALAAPHRLVEPDSSWFILPGEEQEERGLVILGRTAAIEGTVQGDVVVVGGDLFVRPGARISGRALAIGGGVYPSTLAVVTRGTQSFRDETFTITRTASGYDLAWRSRYADATAALTFPGVRGLRVPAYDRVNGVSVPFGPTLTFARGRGEATALATYRSDLGKVDPALRATLEVGPVRVSARAERGTFSNEGWIWPDYLNSASTLVLGRDTRNHYRADRAELMAHRRWSTATMEIEPLIGMRGERSWAVGPSAGERRGPWSILGRTDTREGMYRPNPYVPTLDALSALAGAAATWESAGVRLRARTVAERSLLLSAAATADPESFTQLTSDVTIGFLTFGQHEYEMDVHWVATPGGRAPPQRFSWLGGSGTLPFLDLLEQGGGELLFVDQRYSVPLTTVRLGMLGSPTLQLRHRLGSAGPAGLPDLEQAVSVGAQAALVRVELQVDPATGDTRVSFGLSLAR